MADATDESSAHARHEDEELHTWLAQSADAPGVAAHAHASYGAPLGDATPPQSSLLETLYREAPSLFAMQQGALAKRLLIDEPAELEANYRASYAAPEAPYIPRPGSASRGGGAHGAAGGAVGSVTAETLRDRCELVPRTTASVGVAVVFKGAAEEPPCLTLGPPDAAPEPSVDVSALLGDGRALPARLVPAAVLMTLGSARGSAGGRPRAALPTWLGQSWGPSEAALDERRAGQAAVAEGAAAVRSQRHARIDQILYDAEGEE